MQKLKSEKGITLIALVITVVVLSLISVPVLINASKVSGIKRYSLFKSDIDTLREAIDVAYANDYNIASIGPKYTGDLSVLNGTQNGVKIKNDNDNDNYYVIDVTKLNEKASTTMQELNFGSENNAVAGKTTYTGGTDVYIVNEKSKTIYYVQGLTYKGKTYYRLSENFTEITETIKPGEYVTEFNKAFIDKYGSKAMIPVGYAVSTVESEQIVADGLVIKDKSGNEFVWIPTTKFVDKNYNTVLCGYKRAAFGNQKVVADDQETESEKIKNKEIDQYYFIEAMPSQERLSVMENMGFYIGRYETASETARTQDSKDTVTAIKKGMNVYNWTNFETSKRLAEEFVNNEYVSSKICSSYVWDTTLEFLNLTGNSSYLTDSTQGNYSSYLNKTGATTAVRNIYDLGGNVGEWTSEICSDSDKQHTVRGGKFGENSNLQPAINRQYSDSIKAENIGFRIVLFLK